MTKSTRRVKLTRIGGMRGNTLLLALLGFGVLLVCMLIGSSFLGFLLIQNRLQKFADEVALTGACQLNDNNRLGQMNNLVARSRQLVFASRTIAEISKDNSQDIAPLAEQLLEEDRENAKELEKERVRLQKLTTVEGRKAVMEAFNQQTSLYNIFLPWLKVSAPRIVSIELGSIVGVESNVQQLTGIEELASYDKSMKYMQPASSLYRSNIDLKLPASDRDLSFKLSSLSAPVRGNISPARLTLADAFQPQTNEQLPSAVKVVLKVDLTAGSLPTPTNSTYITSTAATNGASPVH